MPEQTDKKPLIILGIAAAIILGFFIYNSSPKAKYHWREDYKEAGKNPYGTFVLHDLLKASRLKGTFFDIKQNIAYDLKSNPKGNANYIFIGEAMYLDTFDVNTLLSFVEEGNAAFISSKTIPYDLMYYLYNYNCQYYWSDYNSYGDTIAQLRLYNDNLNDNTCYPIRFKWKNKTLFYNWHFIDSVFLCQPNGFEALGSLQDSLCNFARIAYGEGYFYLHTSPLAFTNFHMIDSAGLEYANGVCSFLHKGPIYWDRKSRVSENVGRRRNNTDAPRSFSKGPLSYILSQPPLAWAWYIALALTLLYLIFGAKRKQRTIPVLKKNKNTSLEFIDTIGNLYFQQQNHRKLSLQKMKLFLSFLRERYHINTSTVDEPFFLRLSAKSEIPIDLIRKIFLMHSNIYNANLITEQTLIDFHLEMDKFYKNCK